MPDRSAIEWTDATWNPARGCTRVSPGCENCYAERIAARFSGPGQPYEGLATRDPPRWTRETRLIEAALTIPLHWKRPRRVFVNSMSDLFHESLPDEAIDRVFAVMALCPRHTFQVLTKRPERMRAWFNRPGPVYAAASDYVAVRMEEIRPAVTAGAAVLRFKWPLPNVWLGVSIEDRPRGLERAWHLAGTPASVRFWSVEPLLADLGDLTQLCLYDTAGDGRRAVHWVIAGGESGPGARPCHPDWIRSIRDQCVAARVPFFFKQWGAWHWLEDMNYADAARFAGRREYLHHSCGRTSIRYSKKANGRLLDGREWNEFPT